MSFLLQNQMASIIDSKIIDSFGLALLRLCSSLPKSLQLHYMDSYKFFDSLCLIRRLTTDRSANGVTSEAWMNWFITLELLSKGDICHVYWWIIQDYKQRLVYSKTGYRPSLKSVRVQRRLHFITIIIIIIIEY